MVPNGRCALRGLLGTLLTALLAAAALAACGGGGGNPRASTGTPANPENRPPVFTSSAGVTVPEDTAGVFHTVTATDPDGDAVTFSLAGGVDQAQFRLTSAGGLSFVTPPDFEQPADADRDNIYFVTVAASDGRLSATQSMTVTVTDVGGTPFRVRRLASGLDFPVFIAPLLDGTGRMFVIERAGRIRFLAPSTGAVSATPFLDIAGQVSTDGERGLLGFATAPDYVVSGRFYVFMTTPDGTIEVRRYQTVAGDPDRADPNSADVILRVPHPRSNHNGGWIAFGPDRNLYIAIGDGGGAGDPDNNGQNLNTVLGKILRVDPSRDDFPADTNRDYAIPPGNPFPNAGAPEIWAYGLRNPFRSNFDSETGDLLIGDVGQGAREEINLMRPLDGGANFGWPILEGTAVFRGGSTAGLTPPVAEYLHGTGVLNGSSVTGGVVYRGRVESLRGLYVFADFVLPNIWSVPASQLVPGQTLPSSQFKVRNSDFAPDAGTLTNIVSIGVDGAGDVYLVDFDGEIFIIELVPLGTPTAMSAARPQRLSPQALLRESLTRRFGTQPSGRRQP